MSEEDFTADQLDEFWLIAKIRAEREIYNEYRENDMTAAVDTVERRKKEKMLRYYREFTGEYD